MTRNINQYITLGSFSATTRVFPHVDFVRIEAHSTHESSVLYKDEIESITSFSDIMLNPTEFMTPVHGAITRCRAQASMVRSSGRN